MVSLDDILKIREKVIAKWGVQYYKHVDFAGLVPVLDHVPYHSTPKNSLTFAVTEGDGVHFGILKGSDDKNLHPVVMSVPMVSKNLVIAETLEEFLGIGFNNGWFALEQLVYDFQDTIKYYSTKDDSLPLEAKSFLEFLRKDLKMKHYSLTEERLKYLSEKYVIDDSFLEDLKD